MTEVSAAPFRKKVDMRGDIRGQEFNVFPGNGKLIKALSRDCKPQALEKYPGPGLGPCLHNVSFENSKIFFKITSFQIFLKNKKPKTKPVFLEQTKNLSAGLRALESLIPSTPVPVQN